MNESMEKVFEYIDTLAIKLGVASEHVYGMLVKQHFTEGFVKIGLGVCVLIIGIVILKFMKKVINKYQRDEEEENEIATIGLTILLMSLLASIVIFNVYHGVLRVVNPEYYAIEEVLKLFKK